jgi:hypothetical protein
MFGHWPKGFVAAVRSEQISRRWRSLNPPMQEIA